MEDQKRSSMLLFLSNYKNGGKTDSYTYTYNGKEYKFEGDQTNDAPTKCLIKIAQENNNPIDTIICIVSKEVFTNSITPDNQTVFERFKDMIATHCSEEYHNDYKINIIPIGYDFKVPPEFENGKISNADSLDHIPESEERYLYIYKKVEEKLGLNMRPENSGEKIENIIYMDYTGGFRDSSSFMIALIRYLEFKGIVCKDIIYSNFHSKKIHSIRSIYNMFDMINGVSEFIGTGNARQLITLQESLVETTNNGIVKNFVKNLQSFSDAIALCNVGSIVDAITSISESINTLEQDISDDIFVQMFKTLIPTVKEKLYIGKEPPSILDLSKWCLDNNMLQQAVTIYNEKILSYYILNNYDDFKNELKKPIPKYRSYKDIHEKYKNLSKIWDEFNDSDGKRNKYKKKISDYIDCEISNVQNKCKDFEVDEIEDCSIIVYKALKRIKNQYTHEKKDELSKDILHKATNFQDFMTSFMNNEDIFVKCVKDKITKDIKPIFSLQELETSNPKLWQAMKYYHAIKILRNNINHVSGDVGGMNAKMQEYLEEKGLGDVAIAASETFKFELESKFISDTLEVAIEFSKEICKN